MGITPNSMSINLKLTHTISLAWYYIPGPNNIDFPCIPAIQIEIVGGTGATTYKILCKLHHVSTISILPTQKLF